MQQYQVEMIAQYDNASQTSYSTGTEENMLPYSPESTWENSQSWENQSWESQAWDQSYNQSYNQYYGAQNWNQSYDNSWNTQAYNKSYNNKSTRNYQNQNELICEEVPKQVCQNPASQGKTMKVKKDLCQFWLKGCCERGVTCNFAHGEHQIGEAVTAAPIATCKWWMQGTCRVKNCKYAHFRTDVEGELLTLNPALLEESKLAAKADLETVKQTEKSIETSSTSVVEVSDIEEIVVAVEAVEIVAEVPLMKLSADFNAQARLSNSSQVSEASQLSVEAAAFIPIEEEMMFAEPPTAAVEPAVPAFHKPQTAEEREQLMALLGNVMAALQ